MAISILNCRAVQPFVQAQYLNVDQVPITIPRMGYHTSFVIPSSDPVSEVTINYQVFNVEWASVFVDGFRIVNTTLDFGNDWTQYSLEGNQLIFSNPISGTIDVFYDGPWTYTLPDAYYINVTNVQGAKTVGLNPGDLYAGTFCEPMILSLPTNGFVRLTDDHLSLVYVPNQGFHGTDAFSYTVLTDRGQIAAPQCVYVTINKIA